MKQIPVEQLFAKSTQGTWECGGEHYHAIGIGPNTLLGSFANPNDSIVATHCRNHFRELLAASKPFIQGTAYLTPEHFDRLRSAVASASSVEMEG